MWSLQGNMWRLPDSLNRTKGRSFSTLISEHIKAAKNGHRLSNIDDHIRQTNHKISSNHFRYLSYRLRERAGDRTYWRPMKLIRPKNKAHLLNDQLNLCRPSILNIIFFLLNSSPKPLLFLLFWKIKERTDLTPLISLSLSKTPVQPCDLWELFYYVFQLIKKKYKWLRSGECAHLAVFFNMM